MNTKKDPPIRSMPIAILLFISILLCFYYVYNLKLKNFSQTANSNETEWINSYLNSDKINKPPVIAILGSSKIFFALSTFLNNTENTENEFVFYSSARPYGGKSGWEDQIENIKLLKPKFLFIEKDYLFKEYKLSADFSVYFKNSIKDFLIGFVKSENIQDNNTANINNNSPLKNMSKLMATPLLKNYKTSKEAEKHERQLKDYLKKSFKYHEKPNLIKHLEILKNQRTKIVLLNIPNFRHKNLYPESMKNNINKGASILLETGLVEEWKIDLDLQIEDYNDIVHLNDSGSRKFSHWLIKKVNEIGKEQCR